MAVFAGRPLLHDPEAKGLDAEAKVRLVLDCYLTEAEALQSEMDKRLERHAHSFYFFVTLLAAVIAVLANAFRPGASLGPILVALAFLPWLTTPLAALFFDDELLRALTDCHIHQNLAPNIRDLLLGAGCDARQVFHSTFISRFKFLREELKISSPRIAAKLRPLLFFVPFIAAFTALFLLAASLAMGAPALPGIRPKWGFAIVTLGWLSDLCLVFMLIKMRRNSARLWKRIEKGELPAILDRQL